MRKSVWLLSAGLVALSAPALAQQVDTSGTAVPPNDATSVAAAAVTQDSAKAPAPAASPAPAPVDLDEIVVTAQGRVQVLEDVPISVTAVGPDQMRNSGASDIRQLNQLAPSLLVSSTGSEANGSARVRGIGTVGDNPGLESSVAVFIDGVYRSRSGIGLNELGELERIEVLRGPQGTLFGRNASAGLINIISKKPSFTLGGYGEATVGNYNLRRIALGLTGPLSDTLAFRIDGVGVKRDGFLEDTNNGIDLNNRKRFFTRGQLLFQPDSNLSIRLIGDYSKRHERCCAAVYVNDDINPNIGGLNDPAQNNIVRVLRDLGQNLAAFQDPYSRDVSVSRGRGFDGRSRDGGVSLQADYDLGDAKLTSITAYRGYKASQGGDFDYGTVDILYRPEDDSSYRRFRTFSQELRLQGSAFNKKLDWLVGGYFANEDLKLQDTLRFGSQYGQFAACRLITGSPLAGAYSPTSPSCINPLARPTVSGAFGPAGPTILAAIDRLGAISDRGSTGDVYNQNSRNFALFTHNIFHVTDRFDVTVGLRYTTERKKLDATFGNDNLACVQNQAALAGFLTNAALAPTAGAILGLSCQGNTTAELNGVSINGKRSEHRLTGTGVLSYKVTDDLLTYASYSRGYKAGGFNLDRSALKSPILPFSTFGGAQALAPGLQFDPEIVDAFELGAKYSARGLTVNLSLFRQQFKNFQLNTFDGTVFIVQNINGCTDSLGGTDTDQARFVAAPNYNAAAATTGSCSSDNVGYGVRSQGVELETSYRLMSDLRVNAGVTVAKTSYRSDLVGTDNGAPLNPALRELPGRRLSNAPGFVATGAIAYTPAIGSSGLTGLFYVDGRYSSKYNTGSDLFPQKGQEAYALMNARIGLHGPDESWGIELWAQNLLKKNYTQVAFNSPFQEGATSTTTAFADPQFPGGRQIFSAYLAEPRTYGLTLRGRFSAPRAAPPVYVAPPAPPPPPAMQTCADGSMIEATAMCPVIAPPPAPVPAPAPERG